MFIKARLSYDKKIIEVGSSTFQFYHQLTWQNFHTDRKPERLRATTKQEGNRGKKADTTILEENRGLDRTLHLWWSPRVKDNNSNKDRDNWWVDDSDLIYGKYY